MPIFRKKPVEIEARQLTATNGHDLWEWADSKPMYGPTGECIGLRIYTLEGDMKADFGDWIIKGINGEFYPCKPDIFEQTYELVQDTCSLVHPHPGSECVHVRLSVEEV